MLISVDSEHNENSKIITRNFELATVRYTVAINSNGDAVQKFIT